jgi:uncharacterized protein (DUF1015 family)
MARDRVQELGENGRIEVTSALLDHPQPEMDVAQQSALVRRSERRPRTELADPPDVVQERSGQHDVVTQSRMELRRLPAERRHADRVLEEATRVAVVPVRGGGGKGAESLPDVRVAHERVDDGRKALVRDLGGEELEEAVELADIAPKGGRERGRISVLGSLDRAHLNLELPAKALDAAEHAHGVTFREALVEQIDVVPDARFHPAARVDELESEVGGARASAPALLSGHREHAFDGPVLDELGDRGHVSTIWREPIGTLAAMADIQPFRAVRYAGAAGVLADLVAPPYDAVDDEERAALYTRSPYNVVHVTLPESAGDAGRLYREWLAQGVLVRDDEPAVWLAVEEFVGPDGVARERRGVIVSVAATPYADGGVLPHERTHPRIREERRRLLRETRVQPEPILLLADAPRALSVPSETPDVQVNGTRLWRLPADAADSLRDAQLLIADGHHRYESAVELGGELGVPLRIMALVVPTDDAGLELFPTHRYFVDRADVASGLDDEPASSLEDALVRLQGVSYERAAVIRYRRGDVGLMHGEPGELDVELVDHQGLDGIRYTPRLDDALDAVDSGSADAAFVLRQPRVEDVFSAARRGSRMPPKSTYFYPKPLSGLLFHPVTT